MYKIQKRDSTKPPSDIENYFLVKRGKERTLEEIALEKLNARRRELRLKLSEPLTKKVFIETLVFFLRPTKGVKFCIRLLKVFRLQQKVQNLS